MRMSGFLSLGWIVLITAAAFAPGQEMESASGFAFVTQTNTSTIYSYRSVQTTSIQFTTATATALTQTSYISRDGFKGPYGPYIAIELVETEWSHDTYTQQISSCRVKLGILNLLNTHIVNGKVFMYSQNLEGTFREEFAIPFGEINPRDRIMVEQIVPLSKAFFHGRTDIGYIKAEVSLKGNAAEIPVTTHIYMVTQTSTLLTAYETESASDIVVLLLAAAGAIFVLLIRKPGKTK
ncbi:MAG: hypothetical protein V1857_03685 [archaeon]